MVRRSVLSVVAVLAMVLGGIFVSTPAGAVPAQTLPAGDAMYAIGCNNTPGQLNSVDAATAAFTPIGSSQNIDGSECGYGMAFNPVTGKSYVLAGNNTSSEWPIVEVDLTTGVQTEISRITINGSPTTGFPAVMAFDASGNAYAIVANDFYALDITTGNATLRGGCGNFSDIYALGLNPVDGGLYAVSEDGQLMSIDPTSGTGTLIVDLEMYVGVYSLQFDSNGFGWLNAGVNSADPISSFDLADPQATLVDSSADATTYSGAYLIVPAVPPTPSTTSTTVVTTTTAAASDPVAPAFTG
jgi:outer membrane protein assembly factor BamB